jgi:hypothetical protein
MSVSGRVKEEDEGRCILLKYFTHMYKNSITKPVEIVLRREIKDKVEE